MTSSADPLAPVLTPQGWALLNSLPPYEKDASFALNQSLRDQGHGPDLVAAVLTQSRLRAQGRRKFGEFADRMLFTHEGLQQSTRLPVAARHAQRFRAAGLEHVVDLGCGLGGDALAACSLGLSVTAVEADEPTAAAATINLRPFPEAQVIMCSAESFAADHHLLDSRTPSGWGLWLDPARRDADAGRSGTGPGAGSATRRLWDPESFSPPLSFVTALAGTGTPMGVKLGPGLPHELIPEDCEAEWVSLDGDLVEVVLWFNALARPGVRRSATVLRSGESGAEELVSSRDFGVGPDLEPAGAAGLIGTLHEPDPAVIRAGLVADLAERMGGHLLDEHIAYFCVPTEASPQDTVLTRGHRVLEVRPYNVKALKTWAAEAGITSVEIKKRGVDVVPEQLRTQILPKRRPGGAKHHATVVITRLGEDRVFAIVDPV